MAANKSNFTRMATSLVIYEDNARLRQSMELLLSDDSGFKVIGAFPDCSKVLKQMEELLPELVVMDIDMPGVNGIEGLKLIRKVNTDVKILMLTVFDDNKNVFESLKAGANGYVLKKTPPARLLEYISEAASGGAPMTSSIAAQVLKMFSDIKDPVYANYNLSEREKQVLQFLVNGYSYKMIAAEMFIAIDTVRSHIKKIYEKLHVNSKSEAVAKAFKDKIV